MAGKPHRATVAVAAILLLGIAAPAAPAQAAVSTGAPGISTTAVTAAAGASAVDRSTRVVTEARDLAGGPVASTESATDGAAGRLDDGAAQGRDRLSGAVTEVSATVHAATDQVDAAGTRVTAIVGGPGGTIGEQASQAGDPRPEATRDSTTGSRQRAHRREREPAAEEPETAVATSSTAPRTTAESQVAPNEGEGRAPAASSPHFSGSDVSVPSPAQTAGESSIPSRSSDASSAASPFAAVPLVAGEQRQVANAASQPLSTPSNGRPAAGAAWAPASGSAAGAATFLLAFLLVAGMLRPPALSGRLSPFSASAAPVLFLAALERPG